MHRNGGRSSSVLINRERKRVVYVFDVQIALLHTNAAKKPWHKAEEAFEEDHTKDNGFLRSEEEILIFFFLFLIRCNPFRMVSLRKLCQNAAAI